MVNDSKTPTENDSASSGSTEASLVPPVAIRNADAGDIAPPPSIPGKGPMDQSVPDVATGSTPATRRDD